MNDRKSGRGRRIALAAAIMAFALAGGEALAAGGKPAKRLVNVADTRAMKPRIGRYIGYVYNTSMWNYCGLVVLTMVSMGLVLGLSVDRLVGLLGIDLGKLEHHE